MLIFQAVVFEQAIQFNNIAKGTYENSYYINSPNLNHLLEMNLSKGLISADKINNKLELKNNNPLQTLKRRVDRSANFSFSTVSRYNYWSNSNIPTKSSAPISWTHKGLKSDMGDNQRSAWKMGKINSYSSLDWNNGVTSSQGKPGIRINETIGGDDYSDYASFTLTKETSLRINTQNAISQLINSQGSVIKDSNDSYQSSIDVMLKPGTYYLGYSSESSTVETFTSEISFL